MKVLGNDIIVLEHILKFIEMDLNAGNDFEISEFYWVYFFLKVENGENFLKFSKKWKMKAVGGGAPALRVPRAETRLTVYRSLQYRNSR